MVTNRFLVEPQPKIPEGVDDLIVKSEADGRVWHIHSENQGIDRWMEVRRKWEMPEQMIEESKPDAVEYWREVCPYWHQGREVKLQQDAAGFWYWIVTTKYAIWGKGVEKMKDRLSKEQERVLRALAAKDDWMSAYDLQCQMSTLYSLSSRRNYVVRDVMRGGDIAFPKQINWQITTVGREVVAQLDKEQADAVTGR